MMPAAGTRLRPDEALGLIGPEGTGHLYQARSIPSPPFPRTRVIRDIGPSVRSRSASPSPWPEPAEDQAAWTSPPSIGS